MSGQLDGRLVLVVEDEPLVALHVQEYLEQAGAHFSWPTLSRPLACTPDTPSFQRRFWIMD